MNQCVCCERNDVNGGMVWARIYWIRDKDKEKKKVCFLE